MIKSAEIQRPYPLGHGGRLPGISDPLAPMNNTLDSGAIPCTKIMHYQNEQKSFKNALKDSEAVHRTEPNKTYLCQSDGNKPHPTSF